MLQKLDLALDPAQRLTCISVNFSYRQFTQPNGEARVQDLLKKYGIEPARIKLEVTERDLINNADAVKSYMDRLQKEGTMLCLDDFGIGYSNIETIFKASSTLFSSLTPAITLEIKTFSYTFKLSIKL